MEKDYIPSKKYTKEQIEILDIPYVYQDMCLDDYADYKFCLRINPAVLENSLLYKTPLLNRLTKCGKLRKQWEKCQNYRERDLFEEMKKIHLEQSKRQNQLKFLTEKLDNY